MPLDLLDPEFRKDPYPTFERLRQSEPLHQDVRGIWYALRHADAVSLHKDQRLGRDLRKWRAYPMIRPYLADSPLERNVEQWMFSLDPPDHTRLRRLVAKAFTPRSIAGLKRFIEESADALLDQLARQGAANDIDLIRDFASPFPVRIIARILGLSVDDSHSLKGWSEAIALVLEPTARTRHRVAANEALIGLSGYLNEQVARRRADPRDDLLTTLIRAEEDGDRLSSDELISQLVLLFIAGHETTANLVGNGMLALCRHPPQLRRLREDPQLIPSAVEEMLRFDGPANTNGRVAHVDIEIAGTVIPAGSMVLCMLGSANRDPAVFSEPNRFDVGRTPNPHVSFGGGPHTCIGNQLARLEAQVALERLLKRFSTLEVDEASVVWRDLINIRGLEALRLKVDWA